MRTVHDLVEVINSLSEPGTREWTAKLYRSPSSMLGDVWQLVVYRHLGGDSLSDLHVLAPHDEAGVWEFELYNMAVRSMRQGCKELYEALGKPKLNTIKK